MIVSTATMWWTGALWKIAAASAAVPTNASTATMWWTGALWKIAVASVAVPMNALIATMSRMAVPWSMNVGFAAEMVLLVSTFYAGWYVATRITKTLSKPQRSGQT